MPTVREIMMARAKEPAKVHAMDRIPGGGSAPPTAGGGGGGGGGVGSRCPSGQVSPCGSPVTKGMTPMLAKHLATEKAEIGASRAPAPKAGGRASPEGPARPPRPKASGGSPSVAGSGNAIPRKASEGRRPRPGSDPGGYQRTPSEPPARRRGPSSDVAAGRSRDAGVGTEERPGSAAGSAMEGPRGPARSKARASSLQAPRVRLGHGDPAPAVDKQAVGKVPQYLRRRQEEMAEEKRRAERPRSPQAPPGFRKVDETERQTSLDTLRIRKTEAEKAQRALPFKIETVGQKQREKELQDRVAHLDKLIGMFSKPVVFIPSDSPPIASTVPPLSEGGGASDHGGAAVTAPWENAGPQPGARGYRRPTNLPRKEALAPPGGASSLSLGWG
eukprot:TRINITY_DN3935_c1_g1_i1.p1 TRINITY_DN3935_c1_g1~~TRINITY_DN3935_c1_g1_i1.p1  ORF type:complete len:421 (+),score=73.06 TRINITY_DN3935_c1_g1_i1:102-1265(+)